MSSSRDARPSLTSTPATWAVVLGLLTAGCGLRNNTDCGTKDLPVGDPCRGKSCCESVKVFADGGAANADADAGTTTRICGACNG